LPQTGIQVGILLVTSLLLAACASLHKGDLSLDVGIKDRGVASWYGQEFHGKLAANGEVFDRTAYTAAHRKLPLGSIVRVLNLDNGKSVRVRITDRGPYVVGRMLDVSQAAARALDMVDAGTAAVQIEVIADHRAGTAMSSQELSAVARTLLTPQARSADSRSRRNMTMPTMSLRALPQEARDVRRERRTGNLQAANHTAHHIIPVLIIA
jgi:rare lipoprotein A